MLPKKNRLNLGSFKLSGIRKETPQASFVIGRAQGPFKAAVTVSIKVAPKAHDRNRIRRLFHEALAKYKDKNGLQIIIRTKQNLTTMKLAEIEKLISNVVQND